MDVNDYCRSIELELDNWKTKMADMVRDVDKLRAVDKDKISSKTEELYQYIFELEKIIKKLQKECPADFGTQKKKIEDTQSALDKKYKDAMAAILQF